MEATFETKKTSQGLEKPEIVWITLFDNGWQEIWFELKDEHNNFIFWNENNIKIAKQIAKDLFPNRTFGLAPCNQKNIGNVCIDNF
tara:strand:+ start:229 stop:486 length:258 start_codon:yes stop_codon:yes gene_type:complete